MDEPIYMDEVDIVEGLRSEDVEERTHALDALFPDSGGAILLHVKDLANTRVSTSSKCDAPRCFAALLFLAQQFGKHLGLKLAWVSEPGDSSKLVVPNGPVQLPRR